MVTVVQDSEGSESGEVEESSSSGFVDFQGDYVDFGESSVRKDDAALLMLGVLLLHEVYYHYVN